MDGKKFTIRCLKCRWSRLTDGIPEELKDLYEIPNSCSKCGKPRAFRCPKCGLSTKMLKNK